MLKQITTSTRQLQIHAGKKECYYSISFSSDDLPNSTLRKRFKTTEPGETSFQT